MPDCDYCEESFDDEGAYLQHLEDSHAGELGSIDRRRVESELDSGDDGVGTVPVALGLVVVAAVALLAYVLFVFDPGGSSPSTPGSETGDSPAQEPGTVGSVHEHGTIEVVIDGEQLDFSQSQYQLQADEFHFENGNGDVWHKHATGVTLEWAMATLGIGVTEDSVTYQGTTYSDSDPGTEVTVEVNGATVDPQSYVLDGTEGQNIQEGDHVRIVVETDGNG